MSAFSDQLLRKISELHERVPFLTTFPINGCKPEDIEKVMQAQHVIYLPPIYQEFLLTLGYGSGGLFESEDYTIDRLLVLKAIFQENLEYLNLWNTTFADVFVFMDHHSYIHYFFHTANQDPDPIIFMIVSEPNTTGIISCGFPLSDFLLQNKRCE